MAAGICDFKFVILVELFRGLDADDGVLAFVEFEAAGIGIEDEFCVDQVAVIFEQPFNAVECSRLLRQR